jgi:hypothetical protein
MATFPALVPASRTFTAATYPGAVQLAYSGRESRVRTSNAQTGARFRLAFSALTEDEMLSIRDHYYGQLGRFRPFQLSTELLSGMANPSAVTPTGYQWIYVSSPKITDLPTGTAEARSCRHDVELELEMVPEVSVFLSGDTLQARATIAGGAGDGGDPNLPGATWIVAAAIVGDNSIYDGSTGGAAWSVAASIAGGENMLPDASTGGAIWSAAAAIDGGAASDGTLSASARYWRITNLSVSSSGYLEISEFGFWFGAVQRTGTFTSATGPTSGVFGNMTDGNLSTRVYWPKSDITSTWWIRVDLGTAQVVNGVKQGGFDTANRTISALTLQYSNDGTSWTTLGSASGLSYPGDNTLSPLITVT